MCSRLSVLLPRKHKVCTYTHTLIYSYILNCPEEGRKGRNEACSSVAQHLGRGKYLPKPSKESCETVRIEKEKEKAFYLCILMLYMLYEYELYSTSTVGRLRTLLASHRPLKDLQAVLLNLLSVLNEHMRNLEKTS